jgi:hypothetical protein
MGVNACVAQGRNPVLAPGGGALVGQIVKEPIIQQIMFLDIGYLIVWVQSMRSYGTRALRSVARQCDLLRAAASGIANLEGG